MICKRTIIFLLTIMLSVLDLCGSYEYEVTEEEWGSFTPYKTYSYDNRYYAVQSVKDGIVIVSVYDSETDEFIADFKPARSWDFWGICWESDTYNIWIQSGDIGTYCYAYQEGVWDIDRDAERPDDIISKYDKYSKKEDTVSDESADDKVVDLRDYSSYLKKD